MNKSTLLVLALAMLVPTVALADGVSFDGDLRLRWDYGSLGDASYNNNDAVINFGVTGNVSDNVSVTASLRHALAFGVNGDGLANDGALNIQEVYASIADLGAASGVLAGWSLDVGRMELPDYGRVIHSDDWFSGLPPFNGDGYHASSAMGGIDIDIYHYGGGSLAAGGLHAGDSNSVTGFHFGFGDMSGMADLAVGYWSANPGQGPFETASIMSIYANDIGGDNLAGVDLDFEYGTSDDGGAGDSGTLTVISFGYQMEGVGLHASNSVADENWFNMVGIEKHGTYGITDLFIAVNDVEATTIGADFQPMDGMDATVNFISLSQDSTGDDYGTEIDLILGWDCGDDVRMDIGYGSFSPDGSGDDTDYVYLQTGWDF